METQERFGIWVSWALPQLFLSSFADIQVCPDQVSEETRLLRSPRVWMPSPVESDSIPSC